MPITTHLYNGEADAWNAFVVSQSNSTNYHQYGWRKVIEKSFGHRTVYLVATDSCNSICGVLPYAHMKSRLFGNFLVSLPYFNYGGLLTPDARAADSLLNVSQNILSNLNAEHIELRHIDKKCGISNTKQHKVTMVMNLEKDDNAQWNVLETKVRNQIRKAEKNGLKAVIGRHELLDGFYAVFSRNMRDLGTPVYDRCFFRNILDEFPETTKILSVVYKDKIVASAVLTWFKGTMEVPWASSIRDYKMLCPNNLLYWEALRFSIRQECSRFDFGRSTPGEGTFMFKKQWGAQPIALHWQYLLQHGHNLPEINPKNPRYQLAIRAWKRMPLVMANLLGPHIVCNIP